MFGRCTQQTVNKLEALTAGAAPGEPSLCGAAQTCALPSGAGQRASLRWRGQQGRQMVANAVSVDVCRFVCSVCGRGRESGSGGCCAGWWRLTVLFVRRLPARD